MSSKSVSMSLESKLLPSRSMKNALVLSTVFLLLFTGYNGAVNLMSSLNIKDGVGTIAQAVYYFVSILAAVVLPPLCMKVAGVKKAISFSVLVYTPYIAANFLPSWYTFLPTALLIGMARAPLWSSCMSYMTAMAEQYSAFKSRTNSEANVFLFLGLVGTFVGLTNVFGNLTSYFILKPENDYIDVNISQETLKYCGVNFCDKLATQNEVILQPSQEKVFLLIGAYVIFVVVASLVSFAFLDHLDLSEVGIDVNQKTNFYELLSAPFKRLKISQHWFLIPLTVFAGLQESFIVGDYTKAYVACTWGIHHIGLTMTTYGASICMCTVIGWIVKILDRSFIFLAGSLLQAGAMAILWYWTPEMPNYLFYLIPAMWGLGTVVWQSQVQGLYGVMFSDAKGASFALQTGLQSAGYMVGFAMSSRVCTAPKLVILFSLLALGMVGYTTAEITYRRFKLKAIPINKTQDKFNSEKLSVIYRI